MIFISLDAHLIYSTILLDIDISGNKDYRKYDKYDNMPALLFLINIYI